MSDNAFPEKAGLSQEILPPIRRCRHASIRTPKRVFARCNLGVFQPGLPGSRDDAVIELAVPPTKLLGAFYSPFSIVVTSKDDGQKFVQSIERRR